MASLPMMPGDYSSDPETWIDPLAGEPTRRPPTLRRVADIVPAVEQFAPLGDPIPTAAPSAGATGCWVAYAPTGPRLIAAFSDEIDALRAAVAEGGKALFLPWGLSLDDAVNEAES